MRKIEHIHGDHLEKLMHRLPAPSAPGPRRWWYFVQDHFAAIEYGMLAVRRDWPLC